MSLGKLLQNVAGSSALIAQDDSSKILMAQVLRELQGLKPDSGKISDYEFKVFSQWGEDGILQYLISKIKSIPKTFVEFGVENYREANTRLLVLKDNWSGLVIDGSEANVAEIQKQDIYWKYNVQAQAAFVTKDNINGLINEYARGKEIGLLSVDIDGCDYWVWQAIEVIKPSLVIAEYNSLFGSERAITIPYNEKFRRNEAHFSNLYYGASLRALEMLGTSKGYSLVGSNTAGNNVFFVRNDVLGSLKSTTTPQAYVQSQFRESRTTSGALSFLPFPEAQKLIRGLPVWNVTTQKIEEF